MQLSEVGEFPGSAAAGGMCLWGLAWSCSTQEAVGAELIWLLPAEELLAGGIHVLEESDSSPGAACAMQVPHSCCLSAQKLNLCDWSQPWRGQ